MTAAGLIDRLKGGGVGPVDQSGAAESEVRDKAAAELRRVLEEIAGDWGGKGCAGRVCPMAIGGTDEHDRVLGRCDLGSGQSTAWNRA